MPSRIISKIDEHPLQLAASKKDRGIALFRLLGFLAIAVAVVIAVMWFVTHVLQLKLDFDAGLTVRILLISQAVQALLTVVVPTLVMLRMGREPATHSGWGGPGRRRQLGIGALAGAGLMTGLLLVLAVLGAFSFGALSLSPLQALTHGLGYAVAFLLTALAEEGFVRGYGLVQLSRALSFWPAALITSLAFAALHLTHSTETPLAILQAGLIALVLAYSFYRSGGLWFALGFHAAWNFTQTFVFGVPDSGVSASDVLMHSSLHGAAWLTGSTAGPEGSLLALPVTGLAALIVRFACSRDSTVRPG